MSGKLHPPVFSFLPPRAVKPRGWLKTQLRVQADGLGGHLDKYWPDVMDSAWIGGKADGWERTPYWLDGFVPLAFLLEDEDLIARAKRYVDAILAQQEPDGWIGPGKREGYDLWAIFLILKVLVLYHGFTDDSRIEPAVAGALHAVERHVDGHMLAGWGKARWFEALLSIYWIYERTEDEFYLGLAAKLAAQGFDWVGFFGKYWPYAEPDERGRWSFMSHVVNNAMMLKSGPLLWRLTGDREQLASPESMFKKLDKYHGMATGLFTGDECLAGTSPVQGTELCAVVETMFSLEHLICLTGGCQYADRLEKIAFNALPGTFSPDMWTHQYDQQANQIECSVQKQPVFLTNGPEANLFGPEPNFGCCTANFGQGWPKLALSGFLRAPDGVASAVLTPSEASLTIGGADVTVALDTEYPFRDALQYTVAVSKPCRFAFYIRIPEWAEGAQVTYGGQTLHPAPGGFFRFEREWKGTEELAVRLPMRPALEKRPSGLYTLSRGPLVYSLAVAEDWRQLESDSPLKQYPHCDYEIYPKSDWNYGFAFDPAELESRVEFREKPFGRYVFSPEGAPIKATVPMRRIKWQKLGGSAAPKPDRKVLSSIDVEMTLLPYGCTRLRMTELPLIRV